MTALFKGNEAVMSENKPKTKNNKKIKIKKIHNRF